MFEEEGDRLKGHDEMGKISMYKKHVAYSILQEYTNADKYHRNAACIVLR